MPLPVCHAVLPKSLSHAQPPWELAGSAAALAEKKGEWGGCPRDTRDLKALGGPAGNPRRNGSQPLVPCQVLGLALGLDHCLGLGLDLGLGLGMDLGLGLALCLCVGLGLGLGLGLRLGLGLGLGVGMNRGLSQCAVQGQLPMVVSYVAYRGVTLLPRGSVGVVEVHWLRVTSRTLMDGEAELSVQC